MTTHLVGQRIRAIREKRGLSQERLAELSGMNDRQTISAMETGTRRIAVDEPALAVEEFGMPLEYFTEPFLLAGEGRFSWRRSGVDVEKLEACERSAGCRIATCRAPASRVVRELPLMRRTPGLTRRSRFGEAMRSGEPFAAEFDMSDMPVERLGGVMEREPGILVLMVDAERGISGAACRLPELGAVLITRHEVVVRRHFDLAHEPFHLLARDAMPPGYRDEAGETGAAGSSNSRTTCRRPADAGRCAGTVPGPVVAWADGIGRSSEHDRK